MASKITSTDARGAAVAASDYQVSDSPVSAFPVSDSPVSNVAAENQSEPLRLTDAATLKALAHPARQLMLAKMQLDGSVTATEVSALVGLSPSACSWHLRALARAGFVVPATEPDGRRTRWRAAARGITYDTTGSDPAFRSAARILDEQRAEREGRIEQAWADREDRAEPAWQGAAVHSQDVVWMTPVELRNLSDAFAAHLRTYRRPHPGERPAGSRQVSVTVTGVPFELEWLAERLRRAT